MAIRPKTKAITEFGDFQTPFELALRATRLLRRLGIAPASILEPTCGKGAFVAAAQHVFGGVSIYGMEINPLHVEEARCCIGSNRVSPEPRIDQGDFFKVDWTCRLSKGEGPWLILGNPPWVTSASLASLSSGNLPGKSNFDARSGIEAITGKSNFDISEWMLNCYLDWIPGDGTVAVICKTSVARKILLKAWKAKRVYWSRIYKVNAMESFGAAVDACFFVIQLSVNAAVTDCPVYEDLDAEVTCEHIRLHNGHLVSGKGSLDVLSLLWGPEVRYAWRSGVKHDCSKVMELRFDGEGLRNGFGECVEIEERFLFPMLKSSDIGNARVASRGGMIVTQEFVAQDTLCIERSAPRTWDYLLRHQSFLNKRASIIYRNRPPFSVFGVGPYTFAPWKVAISSFYKHLRFVVVGPERGRPVVFDDTVCFLPCSSEAEALFLRELLKSDLSTEFFELMIHWSDKRPLTIDLLKRLSLEKLAAVLGRSAEYRSYAPSYGNVADQLTLPLAG